MKKDNEQGNLFKSAAASREVHYHLFADDNAALIYPASFISGILKLQPLNMKQYPQLSEPSSVLPLEEDGSGDAHFNNNVIPY